MLEHLRGAFRKIILMCTKLENTYPYVWPNNCLNRLETVWKPFGGQNPTQEAPGGKGRACTGGMLLSRVRVLDTYGVPKPTPHPNGNPIPKSPGPASRQSVHIISKQIRGIRKGCQKREKIHTWGSPFRIKDRPRGSLQRRDSLTSTRAQEVNS